MDRTNTMIEKIDYYSVCSKRDINLFLAIYRSFKELEVENQAYVLEYLIKAFRERGTENTSEAPQVINEDWETVLHNKYYKTINRTIDGLLMNKPLLSKGEFYDKLAQFIMTSDDLPEREAKVFALFICCKDKRLPYSPVDLESGIKLNTGEFGGILSQIDEEIVERTRYILRANLPEGTMTSSLLLRELGKLKDESEKAVLLAMILSIEDAQMLRLAHLARNIPSLFDLF